MSVANVEVVRAGIEAFVAGDLERVASLYAPEASITAVPEGWPEPAPVEGREAVVRQFARLQEDWREQSIEIGRQTDERDWVVVELTWHTRGAGSGVSVATTVCGAYRVEAGKIVESRFFWGWEEALDAIGLSERGARGGA